MSNFKSLTIASLVAILAISCSKDEQVVRPSMGTAASGRLAVSKSEVHEKAARKLAKSLANAQLRSFIKSEVLKKFDGDYDVLFSTVKEFAQSNSLSGVDLNSEELQYSDELPLLNVAVPVNIEKWDAQTYTPLVAYLPEDYDEKTATQITAFDGNGEAHLLDVKQAPTVPVIVISQNERTLVEQGKVVLKKGFVGANTKGARLPGEGSVCGEMPYDQVLYLTGFRSNNLGAIESWANGAPEIRMNAYYVDQASQAKYIVYGDNRGNLWEPAYRDYVNGKWWRFSNRLMRWTTTFGDIVNFAIWEEDSGTLTTIPISLKGKWFGAEVNANTTLTIQDRDEYVGAFPVDRNFCTNAESIPFGNESMLFILDYYGY